LAELKNSIINKNKRMKYAIRYYSKTGHTQKMAMSIAEEIGVRAETVDVPIEEDVDILFLGSAVYAAGISSDIKKFIAGLDSKVKKVVNFSSAAILPSSYSQVKTLLKAKNIPLDEREFHCRGQFSALHRGRPNEKDLNNLKEFVKIIVEK
jgi:flavodoxin